MSEIKHRGPHKLAETLKTVVRESEIDRAVRGKPYAERMAVYASYPSYRDPASTDDTVAHVENRIARTSDKGRSAGEVKPEPARPRVVIASGNVGRIVGRSFPLTWKREALEKRASTGSGVLELLGPSGSSLQLSLPGAGLDPAHGLNENTLEGKLARMLPDWRAVKTFDVCASLALAEERQDGTFWFNAAEVAEVMGLSGNKHTHKRIREQVELLAAWRWRIQAEWWRRGEVSFLQFRNENRYHDSGRRGRPRKYVRVELSPPVWDDIASFHVHLTGAGAQLLQERRGDVYLFVRHVLTLGAIRGSRQIVEPLALACEHSGLTAGQVVRVMSKAEESYGIQAFVGARGMLHVRLPVALRRVCPRQTPQVAAPGLAGDRAEKMRVILVSGRATATATARASVTVEHPDGSSTPRK